MGCEEEDADFPQVQILDGLPTTWSYGDTVIIRFRAEPVSRYRISILQGNIVRSNTFLPLFRDGNEFEALVIMNQPYLEDGQYDLRIQAFNGDVGSSAFHSFSYDGLDLQQSGWAFLSPGKLIFQNVQGQVEREYPLSRSFDRVKISARDSLIYLISYGDGGLEIRDLKNFDLIASISAPLGAGVDSYTRAIKDGEAVFLLQKDGFIQKLESGGIQATANPPNTGTAYFARTATSRNGDLAAIFAFADGSNPELSYLASNLFPQYSRPLNGQGHLICSLEDELWALIYHNGASSWSIDRFNGANQAYSPRGSIAVDSVFALRSFASNNVVFATDQGLYSYSLDQINNPQLIDPGRFLNFQTRRTDDAFILQKGNLIQVLLLNNNLQFAAAITEPLIDYEILYNK